MRAQLTMQLQAGEVRSLRVTSTVARPKGSTPLMVSKQWNPCTAPASLRPPFPPFPFPFGIPALSTFEACFNKRRPTGILGFDPRSFSPRLPLSLQHIPTQQRDWISVEHAGHARHWHCSTLSPFLLPPAGSTSWTSVYEMPGCPRVQQSNSQSQLRAVFLSASRLPVHVSILAAEEQMNKSP